MSLPRTAVELGGAVDETSYSNDTAIDRILRTQERLAYTGIPEPEPTVEALQETVSALKEVVETLIGLRGDKALHALRIGQAVTLNDELLSYVLTELGP